MGEVAEYLEQPYEEDNPSRAGGHAGSRLPAQLVKKYQASNSTQ